MIKTINGFTLIELILAMFIAGVFLFLLGSITRHMITAVDTEQQLMGVEQDARTIHEYLARIVRDASAATIQIGGTCGIFQFQTITFGGTANLNHHFYLAGPTLNELYEENDFNCADGNLLTQFMESASSQVSYSGNFFEWTLTLTDGVDTIPIRIVATPRNL